MPDLESVLENPNKYLLVLVGDLDGLFVKPIQILLQRLEIALANIELVWRKKIYVLPSREIVAHIPQEGRLLQSIDHQLELQRVIYLYDSHYSVASICTYRRYCRKMISGITIWNCQRLKPLKFWQQVVEVVWALLTRPLSCIVLCCWWQSSALWDGNQTIVGNYWCDPDLFYWTPQWTPNILENYINTTLLTMATKVSVFSLMNWLYIFFRWSYL